jgi:hypothetical protein
MKQSRKSDRLRGRRILSGTIALLSASVSLIPYAKKAEANPAVIAAPALCSTGVGCIFVGIAVIGGISYYVWQNQSTGVRHYDKIEDPEEHDQWGIYYAKSKWHCSKLAAGREYRYDPIKKRCFIKG